MPFWFYKTGGFPQETKQRCSRWQSTCVHVPRFSRRMESEGVCNPFPLSEGSFSSWHCAQVPGIVQVCPANVVCRLCVSLEGQKNVYFPSCCCSSSVSFYQPAPTAAVLQGLPYKPPLSPSASSSIWSGSLLLTHRIRKFYLKKSDMANRGLSDQ